MSETTRISRAPEAYSPPAPSTAGGAPRSQIAETPRTAIDDPARLLMEGEQLAQESRLTEAEPLLLRALELYERHASMPAECVQVYCELASIATTRGDVNAAESRLKHALELANARLSADHPDVAAVLGALARLYLRRNQFVEAEPVLERLLEIKRGHGEDHPEVATVLASLATVRSAMGDHQAAEGALRRALAIRERSLAPNHFATVTTLEHLAESCIARGKFDEALSLLHQAVLRRQRASGVGHPSVAAARARIADVELLSSNEALGTVPSAQKALIPLAERHVPIAVPVESKPQPRPEPVVDELPRRELVVQLPEWEEGDGDETLAGSPGVLQSLSRHAESVLAFAQTSRGRLTVLTIGVASLLAAFVIGGRTRADAGDAGIRQPVATAKSFPAVSAAGTLASSGALSADSSAHPASSALAPKADVSDAPPAARPPERRSSRAQTSNSHREDGAQAIPLPTPPRVRALDGPLPGTNPPQRTASVAPVELSKLGWARADAAVPAGPTPPVGTPFVHATLAAGNPAPEYPPELMRRGIEGRVVAEFLVDARGRVDTRTVRIVSSTDEQFANAVRRVVPNLRFIPAESGGAKSEDWVAMPFRFSVTPAGSQPPR